MPFMYRRRIANINRSTKRSGDFIHEKIIKALDAILQTSGSNYIPIVPTKFNDPPFDKADPNKFLALYTIKKLGLSLYEVEHWLDNHPVSDRQRTFSINRMPLPFADERRKYYAMPLVGGVNQPTGSIVYSP